MGSFQLVTKKEITKQPLNHTPAHQQNQPHPQLTSQSKRSLKSLIDSQRQHLAISPHKKSQSGRNQPIKPPSDQIQNPSEPPTPQTSKNQIHSLQKIKDGYTSNVLIENDTLNASNMSSIGDQLIGGHRRGQQESQASSVENKRKQQPIKGRLNFYSGNSAQQSGAISSSKTSLSLQSSDKGKRQLKQAGNVSRPKRINIGQLQTSTVKEKEKLPSGDDDFGNESLLEDSKGNLSLGTPSSQQLQGSQEKASGNRGQSINDDPKGTRRKVQDRQSAGTGSQQKQKVKQLEKEQLSDMSFEDDFEMDDIFKDQDDSIKDKQQQLENISSQAPENEPEQTSSQEQTTPQQTQANGLESKRDKTKENDPQMQQQPSGENDSQKQVTATPLEDRSESPAILPQDSPQNNNSDTQPQQETQIQAPEEEPQNENPSSLSKPKIYSFQDIQPPNSTDKVRIELESKSLSFKEEENDNENGSSQEENISRQERGEFDDEFDDNDKDDLFAGEDFDQVEDLVQNNHNEGDSGGNGEDSNEEGLTRSLSINPALGQDLTSNSKNRKKKGTKQKGHQMTQEPQQQEQGLGQDLQEDDPFLDDLFDEKSDRKLASGGLEIGGGQGNNDGLKKEQKNLFELSSRRETSDAKKNKNALQASQKKNLYCRMQELDKESQNLNGISASQEKEEKIDDEIKPPEDDIQFDDEDFDF